MERNGPDRETWRIWNALMVRAYEIVKFSMVEICIGSIAPACWRNSLLISEYLLQSQYVSHCTALTK